MGCCSRLAVSTVTGGILWLSIYGTFVLARHMNQLTQDNFTEWENAGKYQGMMITCLAMSCANIVVCLVSLVNLMCCHRELIYISITIVNICLIVINTVILVVLFLFVIFITCKLSDEDHRQSCLYYFSWGNVFQGYFLQVAVSIVGPVIAIVVNMPMFDIAAKDGPDKTVGSVARSVCSHLCGAIEDMRTRQDRVIHAEPRQQHRTRTPSPVHRPQDRSPSRHPNRAANNNQANPSERKQQKPLISQPNTPSSMADDDKSYDTRSRRKLCIICMDAEVSIVLIPRGHANLCQTCINNLIGDNDNKCPACRTEFENYNKFYYWDKILTYWK